MRLAWFTPLPPVRSGIARYNSELLPHLATSHAIDLFVDGRPERFSAPDGLRVFDAHDFVWKQAREVYDLVVYQLGNATCHDYMWAYLTRYAGLVALHDGQLHHARGRMLLQQWRPRLDDYREEFRFCHPDTNRDLAELGAAGLLGSLTCLWPMQRVVVEASQAVLVHNEWLAGQIRADFPHASVHFVPMGVPEPAPRPDARRLVRSRHGIPDTAVVFTAFGRITPEKRVREAMRAFATLGDAVVHAHLLLAGEAVEYYDILHEAEALGVAGRVTAAGYVADDEVDDYLAASDVCLCLRWPTLRETSASWLRCLAAGRPTISTDLVHVAEMPTLDPRSWSELGGARPVGVSIDILDEEHSLKLAMRRLAADAKLRAVLGENARALWHDRFRLDAMASGYADAIAEASRAPGPAVAVRQNLPLHLRPAGTEHADALLEEVAGPLRRSVFES